MQIATTNEMKDNQEVEPRKKRRVCSFSSTQLASLLQHKFDEDDSSWTLKETRREVTKYDPHAGGIAGKVLQKLRGSGSQKV